MPELAPTSLPARPELRRILARKAASLDPPLRIIAEDVLGESSSIDLVGVDGRGRVTLLLIGEAGEDLALFTRALAQREWVRARLKDWRQLAPTLELEPGSDVAALLCCPSFSPETRAVAASDAGRGVRLAEIRALQDGRDVSVLLEAGQTPHPRRNGVDAARPPSRDLSEPAAFRSGLTEQELNLTAAEIREFE